MKYKAIISDIDGTFTKVGPDKLPTEKVITAVKKAEEKGITFVLATARPLQLVEYLLDILNNKGYIILDNGAAIYNVTNKSIIWESFIENNTAARVFSIAKKHARVYGIGLSTSEGRVNNPAEISPTMHVRRLNVRGLNAEQADALIKDLENFNKDIFIVRPHSFNDTSLQDVLITSSNATKQHAALKLAELLKISTHEMIGIGDHYNDFPLLMACGLKVAMGNAVDELKEIADYIAPSVDEDGVANVIEKYILS